MTTKRWNAGVATLLSALLSIPLAGPAGAAGLRGVPQDGQPGSVAPDLGPGKASVAVHRVTWPSDDPGRVTIDVEEIRGVIVADGSLPGSIEILLTGTHLPAELAKHFDCASPLLQGLSLSSSSWGRAAEAQVTLAVAEGVRAETREFEGRREIVLSSEMDPDARFVIEINEAAYPVRAFDTEGQVNEIKEELHKLAAAGGSDEGLSWWSERHVELDREKAAPKQVRVTRETLVAVRNANISVAPVDNLLFAAQDEPKAGEAPAEEPAAEEAPSEEPAPPAEEAPAVEPPTKRMPAPPPVTAEANKELTRQLLADETRLAPEAPPAATPKKNWSGSPLQQPVTIDFRDMDLLNVVQILASMAGINVVAGADVKGPVTLYLQDVPLMQAMETALRLNGLGIVEEEGIYHIRPYLEALESKRVTAVVELENADAAEISTTLESVIQGSEFESLISLSSNKTANTVILAGPDEQIAPLAELAKRLDVEQAVLPTITVPIKLNYAEPGDILASIEGMVTPEVGKVSIDQRARMLIVTDIPIIVEKITELVKQLDTPVKLVSIEAMIVDVTLTDAADTGVDWLISAVQSQSRRNAANNTGIFTGNLQELSLGSDLGIGDTAGLLNFGILSGDIDWRGLIQAEVRNNNSTLLSNPKLITVENQPATISIASEIPYVELTSTDQGGQQTSTEFKPIGTTLEVTPTVTHDDHIIAKINAKESTSSQQVNGVPVEDLRQIQTTPHIASGQTIYVGGLRKNNDTVSVRKVPLLGDVPVMNFLFRSNQRNETVNELLIFLTCSVLDQYPELTDYQKEQADRVRQVDVNVSADTALIYDAVHPSEFRDPAWKWRKSRSEVKADAEKMEVEESAPAE